MTMTKKPEKKTSEHPDESGSTGQEEMSPEKEVTYLTCCGPVTVRIVPDAGESD
jgi:hypothetical protein